MAKYLAADNPVKIWVGQAEGDAPCYIYEGMTWKPGYGLICYGSTGLHGKHYLGVLQLDGIFCPIWKYEFGSDSDVRDLVDAPSFAVQTYEGGLSTPGLSMHHMSTVDLRNNRPCLEYQLHFVEGGYGWASCATAEASGVTDGDEFARLVVEKSGWVTHREKLQMALPTYGFYGGVRVPIDPLPVGLPSITYRGDREWYVIYPDGQGFVYNSYTKSIVETGLFIDDFSEFSCARFAAIPELGLIAALCWDHIEGDTDPSQWWSSPHRRKERQVYLRVYTMDGVVTGLGPVTVEGSLGTSRSYTVSVKVRGEQGDGIAGEVVSWSVTAGDGTLVHPSSVSGPGGIATNVLVTSMDPSSVSISASVTY